MSDSNKRLGELSQAKRELLALRLKQRAAADRHQTIPRRPDPAAAPLSFAQQRLWFLDQLEPGNPFYNEPLVAARMTGRLEVRMLEGALDELVRRHETLRTTFRMVGDVPTQFISPELHVPIALIDLGHLPLPDREPEALRFAGEEARAPFDLAHGPLVRATLLRLSEREHMLLLARHHIISDATSTRVLIAELCALYTAAVTGAAASLPALPVQYADFAHWQRSPAMDRTLEAQLAYWKEVLGGELPQLELPTDRPRPRLQSYRGSHKAILFDESLTEAIKSFSQREGVTLFMTLLAGFNCLLYRYTGQTDLLVGTPIAGRTHSELQGVIGFFANTLVMRADIGAKSTFRDVVGVVRKAALDAYARQDLPFEQLVEALQPARDLSRTPIIQVLFVLQEPDPDRYELPELMLEPLEIETGTAKFDLTLTMVEKGAKLEAQFEYNADLFDDATVDRMLGHLEALLRKAVTQPDTRYTDLPLLTPREQHQIAFEWNATTEAFPSERCLHELFEDRVREQPDATAVVCGGRRLTYRELDQRANQLAHHLRALGVRPGAVVGICVERSVDMVVGLVGIVKAGAAYLPLDPAYPTERLAFMIEDTRAQVLVTEGPLVARLPEGDAPIVELDTLWSSTAALPTSRVDSGVTPAHLVYVIFTSGSTGKPKGVMLDHRGRVSNFTDFNRRFGVGPGDAVFAVSSMSFDMCAYDVFGTLAAGAKIVVSEQAADRDPSRWATVMREERCTLWHSVPALLEMLLGYVADHADLHPRQIRVALLGGDWIPVSLPDRLRAVAPSALVISLGGATEVSMDSTIYEVGAVEPSWTSIPYGHPMANQLAYVLDRRMQLVPVGVPGELHLGGVGVAWGYFGRRELTAEKFVPHPFSDAPGARLYKTGDAARWRPDGNLELLGRMDFQVKIRGARIELGEIESALKRHPALEDGIVIAREDRPGQKRLVAYVVPKSEEAVRTDELQATLRQSLPDYMVPAAFVVMSKLPLTPNGKVNRRNLPAPGESVATSQYEPPRSATEQALAEIWQQLLGIERVGIHDNFFTLGGDSIRTIQVISRAKQAGLALTPKQMFEFQTVAELAAVAGAAVDAAEQGQVAGDVTLTPMQRWFFEHPVERRSHWNQASVLQPQRGGDPALLEAALHAVVNHHDALRLRFAQEGGRWRAYHADSEPARLVQVLEVASAAETTRVLDRAVVELHQSLDLAAGPLVRALWVEGPTDAASRLVIVAHHLVVDDASWPILVDDLEAAYDQLARGVPVALPEKTSSLQQWSRQLAMRAQAPEVAVEAPYWTAEARRAVRPLPGKHDRGGDERSSHTIFATVAQEDARDLLGDGLAAHRLQVDEVLLAALAQSVERWTGHGSVLVDIEQPGRDISPSGLDITRTIGWFTTRYPVLLELPREGAEDALLMTVKEQVRSVPAGGANYGLLRYLTADARLAEEMRRMPAAQIGFRRLDDRAGLARPGALFTATGESAGPLRDPTAERAHRLEVAWTVQDGAIRVAWTFSAGVFELAMIEGVVEGFEGAVRALVARLRSGSRLLPTPSDFGVSGLVDIRTLRELMSRYPGIEDVHPPGPMQRSMLWHAARQVPGLYVNQVVFPLPGPIEPHAFEACWRAVAARHPNLRTSFAWRGLAEPVALVHETVDVSVEALDWRDAAPEDQQRRLEALLRAERSKGFDLERPPLFRVFLVRLADDLHAFVEIEHYLLNDAWSAVLLRQELLALYMSGQAAGEALPPSRPYRDYAVRMRARSTAGARAFWQKTLADAPRSSLGPDGVPVDVSAPPDIDKQGIRLDPQTAAAIHAFAEAERITVSTIVQAAWALLLASRSGASTVVYGLSSSGRDPDLAGVESMTGLFMHILPVPVRLSDAPVGAWLRELQTWLAEVRQHEGPSLLEIAEWAGLPRGTRLADSMLVFANYPVDASVRAFDALTLEHPIAKKDYTLSQTEFTLRLDVEPGPAMPLSLSYDRRAMSDARASEMLAELADMAARIVRDPSRLTSDLITKRKS
jgi:amino acid adenylation domain-containing protein/non-ribosomal peptide synthase protein (TIGR01720 family)